MRSGDRPEALLYCGRFREEKLNDPEVVRLVLKTDTFTLKCCPRWAESRVHAKKRNRASPAAARALRSPHPTTAFEESDASGFDECLPSVSACEIDSPSGRIAIPDHGEFWRLPCEVESQTQHEVILTSNGTVLPLRFERKLRLEPDSPDAGTDTLRIDYRIENLGQSDIHYAWAAHPLFAVDPGDRILLPSSVTRSDSRGLGGRPAGGESGAVPSLAAVRVGLRKLAELDRGRECKR